MAVESAFFDLHTTGTADAFYFPPQIYSKILRLVSQIAESDFPPTQAQLEVYRMFKEQIAEKRTELEAILTTDVAGLNARLKAANIPHILTEHP
jgi:hypothetical protein